jgi:hypothetical protein
MTVHNVKFLMTGAKAKALIAKEDHRKTGVPPKGQSDTPETFAKLPVWQRTSTMLAAKSVSPTGGAILAYSNVSQDGLPLVQGWKKILKEMDWHKHGLVSGFLRDVLLASPFDQRPLQRQAGALRTLGGEVSRGVELGEPQSAEPVLRLLCEREQRSGPPGEAAEHTEKNRQEDRIGQALRAPQGQADRFGVDPS